MSGSAWSSQGYWDHLTDLTYPFFEKESTEKNYQNVMPNLLYSGKNKKSLKSFICSELFIFSLFLFSYHYEIQKLLRVEIHM